MRLRSCRSYGCVAAILVAVHSGFAGSADGFNYSRDTLSFKNWTVFSYENGQIVSHKNQFGHHYFPSSDIPRGSVSEELLAARYEASPAARSHEIDSVRSALYGCGEEQVA